MENEVSMVNIVKKAATELNENQLLVQDPTNKNLKYEPDSNMNLLQSFLTANRIYRRIQSIPVTELNHILCSFFLNVCRADGSDFRPDTLCGIMLSIDQYMDLIKYGFSIKLSSEFFHVRMVLHKKQQLIRQRQNSDDESKTENEIIEIKMLWEQGQFGAHTPDSIINTLWFYTSLYFGLRSPKEHKTLKWGDVELCCDASGYEYLEYTKKCKGNKTEVKRKMYSNSKEPNMCPVKVYKRYASVRPVCFHYVDAPFYLNAIKLNHNDRCEDEWWFKRQPMGVITIESIMKRITMSTGIGTKRTEINSGEGGSSVENEVSTANTVSKVATELNENQHLAQELTNKNAVHISEGYINALQSFLAANGEHRPIHTIPVKELNHKLCEFFLNTRRVDGSNYQPETLRGIVNAIDRYLIRFTYGFLIKLSPEFLDVRVVVEKKQRTIIEEILKNEDKSEYVSDKEIEILWECQQFGTHTLDSIINTLWYNNSVGFDIRWAKEHRSLKWGDVKLCCNDSGLEYLEYIKKGTLIRLDETKRIFANPKEPNRCPVNIYKAYASKRPVDLCNADDPFYLTASKLDEQWFKRLPLGVKKLAGLFKQITTEAGIGIRKINFLT